MSEPAEIGAAAAPRRAAKLEARLVLLIAAHSAAVGCALLFAPACSGEFGGWGEVAPLFFVRQAGVFHIVVAIGYLLEYSRSRGVSFLLATKTIAFAFLATMSLVGETTWAVPVSGLADGLMALGVGLTHKLAVGRG